MNKNQENMQEHDFTPPVEEEGFPVDDNVQPAKNEGNETGISSEEAEKLKRDLEEQKDKYIRLFAEFDNYKRRTSKEAIEMRQTAGKEVIISMLDVMDDMDRAEKLIQEKEEKSSLEEGSLLIFDKFRKILQSKGLKALETLHTEFDVEKDEAVSEIPVDDKKLKGKVVVELQKGYYLNDKLIRFAKVVVGK